MGFSDNSWNFIGTFEGEKREFGKRFGTNLKKARSYERALEIVCGKVADNPIVTIRDKYIWQWQIQ
jgi:hypothetical protein